MFVKCYGKKDESNREYTRIKISEKNAIKSQPMAFSEYYLNLRLLGFESFFRFTGVFEGFFDFAEVLTASMGTT
ncbi:hypothetical protein D3C83_245020 [compost metagenome]